MKLRVRLSLAVGLTTMASSLIVGSGVLLINFNSGIENLGTRLDGLVKFVAKSNDDQVSVALERVQTQEVSLAFKESDGTITLLQDSGGAMVGPQTLSRTLQLGDGESLIFTISEAAVFQSTERSIWLTVALSVLAAMLSAGALWVFMARDLKIVLKLIEDAKAIANDKSIALSNARGSQELGELAEALNEMVERLRSSRQQLQDFLSDASHELKTPVTVIRGYLEILEREQNLDTEQSRRAINRAKDSTLKMQALISDLLTLAEFGSAPEEVFEPLWLEEIFEPFIGDLRSLQPNRIIEIRSQQNEALEGSKKLFETFASNAFANLVAHTPADAKVLITIEQPEAGLILRIEDAGPGLDELDSNTVKKHFKRFDQSRTGSGLGLSIMSKIIQLHGGEMRLSKSQLGGLMIVASF